MPGFAYNKKKTDLYADVPKDVKQDFTELIDNTIAQARDTALQGGDLRQGLEALFGVEKQTRQAVDISGTEKVALAIVELCKDAGNWNTLNESLTIIVKRRGQIKQVVTAIVQRGMEFLDDTPNEDTKVGLIETLREVSEGKMHTELERARLTRMLADIKEKNGSIIEAAELMQDLQVETYGSMSKEEKVEYILEQVRLCFDRDDYVRGRIMFKKIIPRYFKDDEMQELKLRWCKAALRMHHRNDEYLELAQSYRAIYDTPLTQADAEEWKKALTNASVYVCLAKYGNDQKDMLERLYAEKKIGQLKPVKDLLQAFRQNELVRWPLLESSCKAVLLSADGMDQTERQEKRLKQFRDRVVEHNIRILAKYYSRIYLDRMAQLLDLDVAESEKFLCDLVVDGQVSCIIDRPAGIAEFSPSRAPSQVLDDWARDIGELLSKVERVGHLINKEVMAHDIKASNK